MRAVRLERIDKHCIDRTNDRTEGDGSGLSALERLALRSPVTSAVRQIVPQQPPRQGPKLIGYAEKRKLADLLPADRLFAQDLLAFGNPDSIASAQIGEFLLRCTARRVLRSGRRWTLCRGGELRRLNSGECRRLTAADVLREEVAVRSGMHPRGPFRRGGRRGRLID